MGDFKVYYETCITKVVPDSNPLPQIKTKVIVLQKTLF